MVLRVLKVLLLCDAIVDTLNMEKRENCILTTQEYYNRTYKDYEVEESTSKRAVNAKTVVVASAAEEEREGEERPVGLLCLRIPDEEDDDDDDVDFEIEEQNEMRKEKTTETKRGGKRKRKQQHECGVCEKVFVSASQLARHVRTHERETV